MVRNEKNSFYFCTTCLQAAHVARLEHLSDAVVCLESFVGTPMETDSTFKAYNGSNVCGASVFMIKCSCCLGVHCFMLLLIKGTLFLHI